MSGAPPVTGLAASAEQVLLLRAALGGGEDALVAWRAWQAATDLQALDVESQRLLPLLYRNLGRLGVEEPARARYAGVYKQSWCKNHLAFHHAAEVIAAFGEAGIDTLVLKGAALALLHYRDVGARAMDDVDVLVPSSRVHDALALLSARGWTPAVYTAPLTRAVLSTRHSTGFRDARGRSFDLHWFASKDALWPGADDILWQAAVPLDVGGARTRALAPSDQLYHVCAHAYASGEPHLRWIADALIILRSTGGGIDWPRLAAVAEARRLVLPLRMALAFLRDELAAPVPADFLAGLAQRRVSRIDRLEHASRMSRRPATLGRAILGHWCRHRRSTAKVGLGRMAAFPDFLCRTYRIDNPWRLPVSVLRRGVRRALRAGLV